MGNDTIREMRQKAPPGRQPRRSFMKHTELRRLRQEVLRVTQKKLAEQLIDPSTGQPVSEPLVCRWENGDRAVPLWAARYIAALSEAAREHDIKEAMSE